MDMGSSQNTITFNLGNEHEIEVRRIMLEVYNALKEKGYNPVNQIVGYILSEDPTYITTHNNARNLIRRVDRDTLFAAAGQVLSDGVTNCLFEEPRGRLCLRGPFCFRSFFRGSKLYGIKNTYCLSVGLCGGR